MPEMNTIYAFDFDGTLTRKDTLIELIRHAHGTRALLLCLLAYSPLLLLMKLKLVDNGRLKERIFAHFFKGWTLDQFNDCCRRFAQENADRLLRPQGQQTIGQALASGARVLVVSASIDNWVAPFFERWGADRVEVLGTQIETADNRLTGRFATPNCYGAEKVRRIRETLHKPRNHYYIKAFGDSRGDKEMLQYADEANYKPF